MDIAIAGAHGQVARRLTRLLTARGDRVRGIIRAADQAGDIRSDGGEPVMLDLEQAQVAEIADAVADCDAVVFAAGAGPGSGAARKETVDYGAAVKLVEAAQASAVRRYVMVSSVGANDPPDGDDVFSVYLRAKAQADEALMASKLDWTIVRPGGLTDDPGTGLVTLAAHTDRGKIPRDDVAAVLLAVLDQPRTAYTLFEAVGGHTPVEVALTQLAH